MLQVSGAIWDVAGEALVVGFWAKDARLGWRCKQTAVQLSASEGWRATTDQSADDSCLSTKTAKLCKILHYFAGILSWFSEAHHCLTLILKTLFGGRIVVRER